LADTAGNTVPLEIPGARGKVTLQGAERIFYKVLIDGEVAKRRKGGWPIPMRNGTTSKLESRGLLPGFQRLLLDGQEIFRMGAHASTAEKVVMFLPLVLIVFGFLPAVIALVLFFMNVMAVKNPLLPQRVRLALPVVNTIAGGLIVFVLYQLF